MGLFGPKRPHIAESKWFGGSARVNAEGRLNIFDHVPGKVIQMPLVDIPIGDISGVSILGGDWKSTTLQIVGKGTVLASLEGISRTCAINSRDFIEGQIALRCDEAQSAESDGIVQEIERLARLRDTGVLSEEEFSAAKKKVLGA